jgi:hypothetical protein
MKFGTGKPKQHKRQKQKPPAAKSFDPQLRQTIAETAQHLRTSKPTVYKLIKAGRLESFCEGLMRR